MRSTTPWTRSEEIRLESLRLQGLRTTQIAVAMGRTNSSICARLKILDITKPRTDRWIKAFSRPYTVAELMERFGVTRNAVYLAKTRLKRIGMIDSSVAVLVTMNRRQHAAVGRLQKALEACHRARLRGGVYDGSFLVWPNNAKPDPREGDRCKFFENVGKIGSKAFTSMNLTGKDV